MVLGAVLLVLALTGFLYLTRGNPVERVRVLGGAEPVAVSEPVFLPTVETLVGTTLTEGNRVEVLFDGDGIFPRLWEALRSAENLITWHVYWFKPGQVADRLKDILVDRARSGVEVLFLRDSHGSSGDWGSYWSELEEAGVRVESFRPFRWHSLYKLQQRTHVRTVVIDGRVGFTGGFAIHDDWRGGGRAPGEWRDTNVVFEGPAVHQLQAAFAADWAEATGELIQGERAFPERLHEDRWEEEEESDGTLAGIIYGAPSVGSTAVERCFALTISGARETLYITNAYFVPDDGFRHLLRQAVERGVDVRVLTPGGNTDRPSAWYAARTHYEDLLEWGVRIYEYRPTMVHAKTVVVDGIWSSVGTMNLDNRSLSLNNEVSLLAHDEAVAERLRRRFLEDLEHATELELETFRERSVLERTKERFFVLFSRFL